MKAPRYIAALVCLFLAFIILQGMLWRWKKGAPDWQPDWWQFRSLAILGYFLSMPALLVTLFFQKLGVMGSALTVVTYFALIVEVVAVYFSVHWLARRLLESAYGVRSSKTVA